MTGRPLGHAPFTVRDAAGHVVLRGRLGPDRGRWNARWPHVYLVELGRLSRPGAYTLVTGGARTRVVVGAPAALYGPAAARATAFFGAQRDGPNVIPGPLHRAPAHLLDARATLYAPPRYRDLRLLSRPRAIGGPVDVSGGWFDAGDYLKFAETASFDDAALLWALRQFPAGVGDPAALRAEARHGTDWLLKLWDPQRRTLVYQVGIGDGNGGSILGDHDLWRLPQRDDHLASSPRARAYFVSHRPAFVANPGGGLISPNLAGRTAAAFALCAQVFAATDPAYAHRCLVAGQTLYDQADTHPHGLLTTSPHAYYDETEWRDDLELAATELYLATRATHDPSVPHPDANSYLSPAAHWADAYMSSRQSGQDSLNLYDVSALAHYDLHGILSSPEVQQLAARDPNINLSTSPGSLRVDLRAQLLLARRRAAADPFGFGSVSGNVDTVTHALGTTVTSRLYDRLTGTRLFEPLARGELNWTLGANPWGQSFVVGTGRDFPHCLAHEVANLAGSLTGRGRVLVGATVGGPNSAAAIAQRGAPDGYRRCARGALAVFDGRGLHYRDDVTSFGTSEPTDDAAALALLAFAQGASG
jgi:endoglucanase